MSTRVYCTRIYPYNRASSGARALARALGTRVLRLDGSRFQPQAGDRIINWGATTLPVSLMALRVYNHPGCVKDARDKLRTLALLQAGGVPTVEWTTNREDAAAWLRDGVVFVRHSLTGQGGSGIEVLDPDVAVPVGADDMPQAPLYTRYFRARHEYRVHVIQGRTYVQKKRRRNGASTALVRNHANGYVYCTGGVEAPASVIQAGVSAVALLGLDFGAADILCTEGGTARVLEVNTAPGLEGSTLSFYAEHMQEMTNGS